MAPARRLNRRPTRTTTAPATGSAVVVVPGGVDLPPEQQPYAATPTPRPASGPRRRPTPGLRRPAPIATTRPAHTPWPSTTTGGTCAGVTPQYTYDAAGNTTKRAETPASATSQDLLWGAEGKLGTLTEGAAATDYVYDAEGELLIRRDPAGETILYTGSSEVHLKNTKKWAARSYSISGVKVAVLTNETGTAKLSFVAGDAHGTSSLVVSADDTQTVSKRYTTPFGSTRGPAAANWPEDKRVPRQAGGQEHRPDPRRRT
ncbi:hypothetical protein [Streptomyces sp. NBC_01207]|uniref:hypothetical protein n=1 Tax=Streptomyces sp. NBC_01207 TaxID=2903772 RepID=UPI002E13AEA5|nr:hypothetical protein OG457_48965 [Streptomyces sp. NBC_01207]